MNARDKQALRRWLAAERAGQEQAAHEALTRLWRQMPQASPSPGFGARVMARAGAMGLVAAQESRYARPFRWLSALVLTLAALVIVSLGSQLRQPLASGLADLSLTEALIGTFALFGRATAAVAAVWQRLLDLSETIFLALQTPGTALTVSVSLAVAILAFRVLHELISRDRSSSYVRTF